MKIEDLENYLQHDPALAGEIQAKAEELVRLVEAAAVRSAELNSRWHDDASQPDHAAYHAPAAEQYPPALRLEYIAKITRLAQSARP